MTAEYWKWVAEKLGIPTAFCVALCVAIWTSMSWVANNVAKPVAEKHIEFLDTEMQNMRSIAKDVGAQSAETRQIHDVLKEMRDDQRKFPAVAEKIP